MSDDGPRDLSEVSKRVLAVIEQHSRLAWPILKTQCRLEGLDPAHLCDEDLPKIAGAIATATARFTSPERGRRVEAEILGSGGGDAAPRSQPWSKKLFGADKRLGPLSRRILDVLEAHTPLGWTILETQCGRANIDPAAIEPDQLARLVPIVERAVARFSSEAKAKAIAKELGELLRRSAS